MSYYNTVEPRENVLCILDVVKPVICNLTKLRNGRNQAEDCVFYGRLI